jgi:transcriptional regulator with XRE-family HTH domain
MTQMELAGRIGTTFQQVQKYEVGTNRISVGRLERIAVALGVSSTTLLSNTPVRRRGEFTPTAPELTAAPDALRLVEAYDRMKPNVRRSFVELAEAIARQRPDAYRKTTPGP